GALEAALLRFVNPLVAPPPRPTFWIAGSAALAATVVGLLWMGRVAIAPTSSPSAPARASDPAVTTTAAAPYQIDAAFYRANSAGNQQLTPGNRVAPGDRLQLVVQATASIYLYVVNEDDKGQAYLLFPLRGQSRGNPLERDRPVRLPGDYDWQVTSAGQ